MPGYHMGAASLIDNDQLQSKNGYKSDNLIHYIAGIYRATVKPSTRYIGFVEFEGIHNVIDESSTFVSGRDACKEIILLKKPQYDDYINLQPKKSGSTILYGATVPTTTYYSTLQDLFNYQMEKAALIEAAKTSEWVVYEADDLVQIKEAYITIDNATNYILNYATKGGFCRWVTELKSVISSEKPVALDEFKIDASHTYNLSFWKTIDPIIYGVVDVASIPLSFVGFDFITDGIGLLYAIPRGNFTNVSIYSASFVMIGVSGGGIKLTKQALKEAYGVTRVMLKNITDVKALTSSVKTFRIKTLLSLPDDANVTDDLLHTFADYCKQGKISDAQFKNIADASTVDDKIRYIREAVESGVAKTGDGIPNLLNKVNNVIDDVGNASLQVADVTDEIVKGSNTLSDVAKKFWANHEVNCTKYLRETYGNANVGRQITVDVTLSNGQVVTCRLDNLVKQGNTYKIIDAKSSIINNLGAKNVDDLISQYATTNQKAFYDALKNGQVQSIKPRGQNAIDYFRGIDPNMPMPNNLQIGNQVEFLVNDVATDGYNIYKKIFSF